MAQKLRLPGATHRSGLDGEQKFFLRAALDCFLGSKGSDYCEWHFKCLSDFDLCSPLSLPKEDAREELVDCRRFRVCLDGRFPRFAWQRKIQVQLNETSRLDRFPDTKAQSARASAPRTTQN